MEVDGVDLVRDRTLVDATCRVRVDGLQVTPLPSEVMCIYHKPAGLLTTMTDPFGRACVGDVVPPAWQGRCGPVGRLDKETTGALVFTDDGALHAAITGAASKRYRLTVQGPVSDGQLRSLEEGVEITRARVSEALRGRFTTAPGVAERCEGGLRLTIWEGRNRQVRRMARAVGLRLTHLHREAVGPIDCPLEVGTLRELTEAEVASLHELGPSRVESDARTAQLLTERCARGGLDPREHALVEAWLAEWTAGRAAHGSGDP